MKKLSKLVYVLGMSSLTLTVSCGEVDTDRVSPEAKKTITKNITDIKSQEAVTANPVVETPAVAVKTIEEIAEIVPSAEDLEQFAKEVAKKGVADDLVAAGTLATNLISSGVNAGLQNVNSSIQTAGTVANVSSEMINVALKSAGDLTVREILANSNQNINDFASTASGIAYTGTVDALNGAGNAFVNTLETADKASTEFWASFANYFGLSKSE